MKHYDLTPDEAEVFFSETAELIEALDRDLVLVEQSSDDEVVHRIFRSLHTLKGAAGSVGHDPMARLAHSAETVLDKVRNHELAVSAEIVTALLAVSDHLKQFLEEVVTDQEPTDDADPLVHQLETLLTTPNTAETSIVLQAPPLNEAQCQLIEEGLEAGYNLLVVYAEADKNSVAPLARLLQVYMQLEQNGQVVASLPSVAELEQGKGQRTLVAIALTELQRGEAEAELAQVFELSTLRVADMSNAAHLLYRTASDATMADKTSAPPQAKAFQSRVEAAPSNGTQPSEPTFGLSRLKQSRTIRTSVERLDALMNLAGELVTDRNRLFQLYEDLSADLDEERLNALNETISHLSTVTDRIHDEVFKARMQPIEYVFNKFPRFVRQTCQALNKQVELIMTGQDTEVDRSVIEHITDPLLHLMRNAIDHGIESTEERLAAGKNPVGRLALNARSEEGNIVVTITDDGRGVDAEKVKRKAINLGLITEEQAASMSYNEAIDLIFAPGLSTAIKISDLSGRGVGMDVVRSNIQRLNGSVVVRSTPGKGTTFELRMPLTLAIIPTLLVESVDQVFALPLHNVLEIFKLDEATIRRVRGREMAHIRGEVLPLVRLNRLFEDHPQEHETTQMKATHKTAAEDYVVSLTYRDLALGVVVTKLLGKQDVVIKSLGHPINTIRGLTGATLLGDGRIGLIIDISALVEIVKESQPTQTA